MDLTERIDAAILRISRGQAPMRIPVDATDPDTVLADCAARIRELEAQLAQARKAEEEAAALLTVFERRGPACDEVGIRPVGGCGKCPPCRATAFLRSRPAAQAEEASDHD